MGSWTILRHMEGVTAAGDVSSWGGSGEAAGTISPDGVSIGAGEGGWAENEGGIDGWAYLLNYTDNSGSGAFSPGTGTGNNTASPAGQYIAAVAWQSVQSEKSTDTTTAIILEGRYTFDSRTITGMKIWSSADSSGNWGVKKVIGGEITGDVVFSVAGADIQGEKAGSWAGSETVDGMWFNLFASNKLGTAYKTSALIAGLGVSPIRWRPYRKSRNRIIL